MAKTIDELKDDNAMLRFQVEQLWRDLKDCRTRLDQAVLSKRMGAKINRNIIDDLKAKNAQLAIAKHEVIGDVLLAAERVLLTQGVPQCTRDAVGKAINALRDQGD